MALEQATGSSDLAARDLSLPTPAVLLLGAEGEGVPNALFDLVDCCVEIPQLGVVRSLNVHVSGAIAVWMFARQVLLKAAGPSGGVHAELAAVKAELSALEEKLRRFPEEATPQLQKKIFALVAKKFPALSAAAPPPPGSPKAPNEDEAAA